MNIDVAKKEILGRRHFYEQRDGDLFMVNPNVVSKEFLRQLIAVEDPVPFSTQKPEEDIARRTGLIHPMRAIIAKRDPNNPNGAKITIQVAFTPGLATNLDDLLEGRDINYSNLIENPFNSATFYSVTKWDAKDRSFSAGDFIIETAKWLGDLYKPIRHFGTLSPIKNLREWLTTDDLKGHYSRVNELIRSGGTGFNLEEARGALFGLKDISELMSEKKLQLVLRQLAAYCISRGNLNERGKFQALDIVANFHQPNGAMPWDIAIGSDSSQLGWERSWGTQANYRYPIDMDKNHRNRIAYVEGSPVVSETIAQLLRPIDIRRPVPQANLLTSSAHL